MQTTQQPTQDISCGCQNDHKQDSQEYSQVSPECPRSNPGSQPTLDSTVSVIDKKLEEVYNDKMLNGPGDLTENEWTQRWKIMVQIQQRHYSIPARKKESKAFIDSCA